MRGVLIHAVVAAVVSAFLVGVWVTTSGSVTELHTVSADPIHAIRTGFWPGVVIATWAAALAIHIGIWLVLLPGRRARRYRRRYAHGAIPPRPTPPLPPAAPEATAHVHDIGREAMKAAIGLVDSLGRRVATRPPPAPAPAPPASGRQWVAVMFTDIAGSTDLTETLGDDTWLEILGDHRTVVRACLADHSGTEVGTQGDGFLVRFDSPDAAVGCATAIQRRLHDSRLAGAFVPEVRIGVHAGEAVSGDGDLVGRVINLASRVTAAAAPGEILVTEPVADHLPPGIRLADRGLRPLKGIAQPRHLLAVVWQADADQTIVLDDHEHS
jgi:class 3 adenylate cyclase